LPSESPNQESNEVSSNAPTPSATRPEVHWLVKLFASGFYSGFSPVASGTIGSAVALAIYFIPGFEQPWVILPTIAITFFFGVRTARAMEARYGHDPGEITIDEMAGMWIALLFLPKNFFIAALAFFIFRIFDIIKPYPARKFDNVHGGMGIMMDDVVAGIYTNLLLHALHVVFSPNQLF